MSATATGLELYIGARVDGLTAGLAEATSAVESASRAMAGAARQGTSAAAGSYQEMARAAERAARSVEAVEDRYAALRIAKGDEFLAAKYLSINKEYARELALVGNREDLKLQIMERYGRRMQALQAEIHDQGRRAPPPSPVPPEAERGTRSLIQAIRDYGKEQREQGRFTRLFAADLAGLLPISKDVALNLGGVAAALMGGFGVMAAFDLAKIAITAYTSAAEEARQKTEALAQEIARLREETGQRQGQRDFDARTAGFSGARRDAAGQLRDAQERYGAAAARLAGAAGTANEAAARIEMQKLEAELIQLRTRLEEIERSELGGPKTGEATPLTKAAEERAAARTRVEEAAAAQVLAIRERAMLEEDRIRSQAEREAQQAAVQYAQLGAERVAEIQAAIRGDAERQIHALMERHSQEYFDGLEQRTRDFAARLATIQPMSGGAPASPSAFGFKTAPKSAPTLFPEVQFGGAVGSAEGDRQGALAGEQAAQLAQMDELARKAKETGSTIAQDLVQPMVSAWGDGIAAMVAGQESLSSVIRKTGAAMLKTVIDGAMKQIFAAKAVGQANAAAANAWNPIVAAAAAAAISGLIGGFLSRLPSAAGGWMVPEDTIASVHAGERILPARYSKGLDAIVEGAAEGGAGGALARAGVGGVSVTLNLGGVLDAQSFRDGLRDRGWTDEIVRALESAMRDGRA